MGVWSVNHEDDTKSITMNWNKIVTIIMYYTASHMEADLHNATPIRVHSGYKPNNENSLHEDRCRPDLS